MRKLMVIAFTIVMLMVGNFDLSMLLSLPQLIFD